MSHMSCKAPHRVAQRLPPGPGHGDTQSPCHTEAHGWTGASSGPRTPDPQSWAQLALSHAPTACPPRCTPAGCGPAPAGSLGRRGWAGTGRRPAACWRRRHAGGTGCSSPHRVRPPAGAQEGGHCPRQGAQTCLPLSPSARGHPELLSPPCTGLLAPMEWEPTGSGPTPVSSTPRPSTWQPLAGNHCTNETASHLSLPNFSPVNRELGL